MPPPKQPPDDSDTSPEPHLTTPKTRYPPAARRKPPTTPQHDPLPTPKSAPAAAAAVGIANRKRSQSQVPSLLGDFLLGKQSPARVAAAAQRRRSVDAAAARGELPRQEMRRASVQRLQQPGGARDRVRSWQRTNAAAMVRGDPEATPTEPTEVGVQVEVESVTEEDRLRIRAKKKGERRGRRSAQVEGREEEEEAELVGGEDEDDDEGGIPDDPRLNGPPKKRIVSDDNWRRRKSPPGGRTTKTVKAEGSPTPIPKNFLQKTAGNPSIQNKIKDWATRVETPESPTASESPRVKKYNTKSGDFVTVEEDGASSSRSAPPDDGIRVRPMRPSKSAEKVDGGIRNRSARKKQLPDDGIRITPQKSSLPDDGIRVRPSRKESMDEITVRAASRTASIDRSTRVPSTKRDPSPSDRIEVIEDPESLVETPTRRPRSKKAAARHRRSAPSLTETQTQTEDLTETRSWSGDSDGSSGDSAVRDGSNVPSSAPAKSLADIPFGYSAFSELDLPTGGGDASKIKRGRAQRNPSFKAVPKVLKKVVSEGKKILGEKVDPPKPAVVNQPPSIETWLSNTVDPFVETPTQKRKSIEEEWKKDARKRSPSETRPAETAPAKEADEREDQENADPQVKKDEDETPRKEPPATPKAATGLKRSGATRTTSSPLKSGGKKPFRDVLREAFRGESAGHRIPLVANARGAADDHEGDQETEDSESERRESRRRFSGSKKRTPSPEPAPSSVESSVESELTPTIYPRRRPPPTNGLHELSTIVSGDSCSTHQSDTMSTISETTITQATGLTKTTDLSRQRSGKSSLKRRLTKHSDLVSVLSLPEDVHLPARTKSIRVARSLHRKTSKLDNASLEDLLREFAEDENLYQRELKTLVDGVVPVLLTQVVHGEKRTATDLFGTETGAGKADTMAKSVVNMGIALEKLKNLHRRVPLHDAHNLASWLEQAYPVYDNYLDVWRLGFQDIIVNLAPVAGKLDDEDSLVNAMTRNENGDVLDENGERVDVAHLLKRPLVRVKYLLKFAKGGHISGSLRREIVELFEALMDKARRRHREEMARRADEDANTTDTTRARDLRNLAPLESVLIDQTRQVNAKDWFSLDLSHSSGQRLECQVELVFRDKPNNPKDVGDVLIRETGSSGRSWLLFPPILTSQISARKGDNSHSLVAMVRGVHDGRDWHQIVTLVADHRDAVAEWLDILGSSPIPPSTTPLALAVTRAAAPSPSAAVGDVPVGERKTEMTTPASPYHSRHASTPTRYHQRNQSVPSSPTSTSHTRSPSLDHTPQQSTYKKSTSGHPLPQLPTEPSSRPLREDMRPDASKLTKSSSNSTPFREDGAPPPPVHRTLGPKKPASLNPPVELSSSSRVRRRTSSPLKHEYHPSDVSSEGSTSSGSGSESGDSSGDELEEDDVPDTLPAISIKKPGMTAMESVVSDCSLTPSNSASQAGVPNLRNPTPEYTLKYVATVSYWHKKGTWKDIIEQACSIVITPGLIEAHPLTATHSGFNPGNLQASGTSDIAKDDVDAGAVRPLIALDLTPLVMIRQSTVVDLEIRSPARSYSKFNKLDNNHFRFRATSPAEATALYAAVHRSRMNNAKFKALEEEARFRSFGQQQAAPSGGGGDDNTSSSSRRRRSWFGRKNSYRASTRAPPSQSQGSGSSGVSASSFLKKLTGGGNPSFNIEQSSVDKQSRAGSGGGTSSFYTSGSSSAGGGSSTPPRSPSVSLAESNGLRALGHDNLKIRCHLQVTHSKWEDHGNCLLSITRPPPGVRQELRLYHGMEKRVIVTSIPKKEGEKALVVLDVVVGSGCFSRLAARGIVLNVWEDLRDENNNVGAVPREGGVSGKVKKWCFQCGSAAEASWIHGLVASEVVIP